MLNILIISQRFGIGFRGWDYIIKLIKIIKMHYSGDKYQYKYKKAIAISEESLNWIKENKGKKSAAGFLEQTIIFYKEHANSTTIKKTQSKT